MIIMLVVLMAVSLCSCKKDEAPVPTPEPTATPVPTPEPEVVSFSISTPTPTPENVADKLKDFVISDADVDGVMNEDVEEWEGYSVLTVEYEGQTVFYVIHSEEDPDEKDAIGSVTMAYDEEGVTSLSCMINMEKNDEEGIQKLYNYFRESFPTEVIGNLSEENWQKVLNKFDLSYKKASELSKSGTESRDIFGQFVFHISKESISFDFYC